MALRLRLNVSVALGLALVGCTVGGSGNDDPLPGHELGPCEDGECLASLVCLSDICVDPNGTGDAGEEDADAESGGGGQTPPATGDEGAETTGGSSGDSSGDATGGSTGDTGNTTGNPTGGTGGTDGTTGDPAGLDGCAIDIVAIMDNTGSMREVNPPIQQAFVDFAEELVSAGVDLRVMAIDTDTGPNDICTTSCESFGFCGFIPGFDCANPPATPMCEALGAGRIENVAATDCGVAGGRRWIEEDQSDFADALTCTTSVGSNGYSEKSMQGLINAIVPSTPAGMCNGDFLRPGAKLYFTFANNQDDDPSRAGSGGEPTGWRSAVVAAKGGAGDIIAHGMIGDGDLGDGICDPLDEQDFTGADEAPRLREFLESWGSNGIRSSVCTNDFAAEFAKAKQALADLCAG